MLTVGAMLSSVKVKSAGAEVLPALSVASRCTACGPPAQRILVQGVDELVRRSARQQRSFFQQLESRPAVTPFGEAAGVAIV
ncbi:MAG TPA: hypothetical protein PK867_02505 [Pirellulales bacterium]|nr:hypothetical protein [Pirellulales bacterium]